MPLPHDRLLVGVIPGEGIGAEVIECALAVLRLVTEVHGRRLSIEEGGLIGRQSEAESGVALSDEIVGFCESIFERGGAILNGPGGGRYVYDLRDRLDLFFKISPLQSRIGLTEASRVKGDVVNGMDILVARENSGGVYQGAWQGHSHQQPATHSFQYSREQVQRFLAASARLAAKRQGRLTVVWKESGVPTISQLWRECALEAAQQFDIEMNTVDVDLMAYRLVHEPSAFDVVAAPNLFGDILGDLGAVLLGSRGNSFSGNFNGRGGGVYQTNHGAAYDLAGTNKANPVGQILSMAMMLRESFELFAEANAVEEGVRQVWSEGWRTADVATPRCRVIGTREFSDLVADRAVNCIQTSLRKAS
ncbi:3-isopropylmalate dehydrogenase [bacterium]|nr:3-isopropylmalate dehydrogenase [bacterium]